MKKYTVQVVVGNVYEITITADTPEQAQDLALELAEDGELCEGGRAVLAMEEVADESSVRLELARNLLTASRLALAKNDIEGARNRLTMLDDVLRTASAVQHLND